VNHTKKSVSGYNNSKIHCAKEGVVIDLMTNPGVQIWEGGIRRYGDLYRLSQAAAYIEQGMDITPLLNKKFTEEEDLDPILKKSSKVI
jgi:hypothetical protein